ncbi:MAG: hypothetical protein AB8B78_08865 [Polaribacter sp.]
MKLNLKIFLLTFLFAHTLSYSQTKEKPMNKLSFMIGNWVGISKTYQNNTIKTEVPAYQKIEYKLNKNIITIDLQSKTLRLHTVIYYDKKDEKYHYNSYYKNGAGKYTGVLKNGKLVISPTSEKRFIFQLMKNGEFQEHGEKLVNGKWITYFKDIFTKS